MFSGNHQIMSVKEQALPIQQAVHAINGEAIIVTTQNFRTIIDSRNVTYTKVLPNGQRVQISNQDFAPDACIRNIVKPNDLAQLVGNRNTIIPNSVNFVTPTGSVELNTMRTMEELLGNNNQFEHSKPLFPENFFPERNTGF